MNSPFPLNGKFSGVQLWIHIHADNSIIINIIVCWPNLFSPATKVDRICVIVSLIVLTVLWSFDYIIRFESNDGQPPIASNQGRGKAKPEAEILSFLKRKMGTEAK